MDEPRDATCMLNHRLEVAVPGDTLQVRVAPVSGGVAVSPGTLDLDQLLPLAFGLRANPGAYALLLGAGVSAPSGIPTAWGVLEDLTRRVAVLKGDDPEDPIRWFEDAFGEAPSYSSVLERLARTKLERQRILRGYFEPDDGDAQRPHPGPTTAHRAI